MSQTNPIKTIFPSNWNLVKSEAILAAPTSAKNYEKGREGHKVQIIALHSAENQELPGQALHLKNWFAGSTSPEASANAIVDNADIEESVSDSDTAWALAFHPLNLIAWSIEITGHASNSPAEWADLFEQSTILEAAFAVKAEMVRNGIPGKALTDSQLLAAIHDPSIKGIITHAQATRVFKIIGGHTDPGPNFPFVKFLSLLN